MLLIGHGSFDGRQSRVQSARARIYRRRLQDAARQAAAAARGLREHRQLERRVSAGAGRPGPHHRHRDQDRRRAQRAALRRASSSRRCRGRRRSRPQRPRLGARGVRLRARRRSTRPTSRAATSSPSTPRSTTTAPRGSWPATQFLAPQRSRAAEHGQAPIRRCARCVEQRDALERQIAELKLRKTAWNPARYEQQLEKLLTELALKTRAIRELKGRDDAATSPGGQAGCWWSWRRRRCGRTLRRRPGSVGFGRAPMPIRGAQSRTTASSRSSACVTTGPGGSSPSGFRLVARLPATASATSCRTQISTR